MSRRAFLPLALAAFVFSCASGPEPYTPLDYSEADAILNEIQETDRLLPERKVEALWRALLLRTRAAGDSGLSGEISALMDRCCAAVAEQCSAAYDGGNFLEAHRLYTSLSVAGYGGLGDFPFDADSLRSAYVSSVPLSGSAADGNVATAGSAPVSSYISGTVTVWVDLGIQVQKGMGYASHVIGSGFFIDKGGYIVTNYHVVRTEVDPEYEGYSRLYIKLAEDSDTRIPARVVGWDPELDLALLKAELDAPYSFALGSSAELDVGDRIYAIGSPAGLERTLTSGIVSAEGRRLFTIGSVMQIDAAINSGNSGGPIIDEDGNVQAVVFAGMLEYQGLNFAIPVEYLKKSLPFLYAGGQRRHGWIGAFGRDIRADEFSRRPDGLEVQYVMPGGSASRAGLARGDVITAVAGMAVDGLDSFHDAILQLQPDTIVQVDVWRGEGVTATLPVYVDVRPENPGHEVYKRDLVSGAFLPIFGMELAPIGGSGKKYTVRSILKGSTADESGFSVHDPVQIVRIQLSDEEDVIYAQLYTKKRKNGYFEVSIMVGAVLDSPYYF